MSVSVLETLFKKIHESFITEINKVTKNDYVCVDSYSIISKTLDIDKLRIEDPQELDLKQFGDLCVLPDVKVSSFSSYITSPNSLKTFFTYILMFGSIIKQNEHNDSSTNENFIQCLQNARKGIRIEYDSLSDEVQCLLLNIYLLNVFQSSHEKDEDGDGECVDEDGDGDDKPDDFASKLDFLENSNIGKLAKEISNEINVDNISNISDISKLIDPKNNFIGDMVSKVGSKISDSISKGEMKQEDLLSEAFTLMSSLGGGIPGSKSNGKKKEPDLSDILNNPMMKNVMSSLSKSMGGGKAGINTNKLRQLSTRERLKTKLKNKS